jgi:hypothetical protein
MKTPCFAITRFNIGVHSHGAPVYRLKNNPQLKTIPDAEWGFARLRIMQMITIPTLKRQTVTDFTWIIIIDAATPDVALQAIEASLVDVPFKWVLLKTDARWMNAYLKSNKYGVPEYIQQQLDPSAKAVVTIQLDSDMGLSSTYVAESIEHADKCTETTIIASLFTYNLHLNTGKAVRADSCTVNWIPSTFTMMAPVEPDRLPDTVLNVGHMNAPNVYPTIRTTGFQTLYTRHECNVTIANSIWSVGPLEVAKLQDNTCNKTVVRYVLDKFGLARTVPLHPALQDSGTVSIATMTELGDIISSGGRRVTLNLLNEV